MGISTLLNIGNSALFANQANIQVTGNNIANVNTPNYSRQYVVLQDALSLTTKPGAQGQGVNAKEVMRRFNSFLEKSFVQQTSVSSRWTEQYQLMQSVENIFNEANRTGISSQMSNFFKGWQDLTLRPEDAATRTSLVSLADNMSTLFRATDSDIKRIQREMDLSIADQVKKTNELAASIADLNRQIQEHTVSGTSNPNSLLDKRDEAVRELATCVDVTVQDRGGGDYTVYIANGMPLVEGTHTNSIEVQPPKAENNLSVGSAYEGAVKFEGSDSHEYTVEIVRGGSVGDVDSPLFRVSLDGGKTWLRNDDGTEKHFEITDEDGDGQVDPVQVKNLKISFTKPDNFQGPTANSPNGDRFTIVPKEGLYWVEPTRSPINITPQVYFDGTDNQNRITGGKLTSYYNVRDDNCGRYLDELNATANSLIWEVNRLHSQGAGTQMLKYAQGTYAAYSKDVPLGKAQSGLPYYDRLTGGNLSFSVYDDTTGMLLETKPLDFSDGSGSDSGANFDPDKHTLQDVADAVNRTYAGPPQQITAKIENNQLLLTAGAGVSFACGTDTTGVLAALGINTFFDGSSAADISVNADVHSDITRISAGHVNGQGEVNAGDNDTATAIAELANKAVRISTAWKTIQNQSVNSYYNNLVGTAGADTRTAKLNAEYNYALAADLDERTAAVSGVNLDEEMSNLIKFQHSYTAAAKLITTADQMLQTILGLKQ